MKTLEEAKKEILAKGSIMSPYIKPLIAVADVMKILEDVEVEKVVQKKPAKKK